METEYEAWRTDPTPANMGLLLDKAKPVFQSAIKSYGQGNEALLPHARRLAVDAFKNYDASKGTKLQTHLMTQLQPLRRRAREYAQVTHVPERVNTDLYQVNQAHQKFFDRHGREPSDREMADATGLSLKRIGYVRTYKPEIAESGLADPEGGIFYPGTEKPDPEKILIEYVHHDLDPVDQKILEWRTGLYGKEKLENREIAKRLSLSPGAVSQRAARIAQKMADLGEIGI